MSRRETLSVDLSHLGKRLDVVIAERFLMSRAFTQKLILQGNVRINSKPAKTAQKIKKGDWLEVSIPQPVALGLEPENIPIEILYQDSDVAVIDKPAHLVVHPGSGNWSGTLVNALLFHITDLSGIGGTLRPGIVHRLDKDTSGVIVVAKNDNAHLKLSQQFKAHTIKREYRGIIVGCPKVNEGKIDLPLGRSLSDRKKMSPRARKKREAVTRWQVIEKFTLPMAYCRFILETGRTHQIRVHMAAIGHPILADSIYSKGFGRLNASAKKIVQVSQILKRQALHAAILGFMHPTTGQYMEFSSPLPPDIDGVLQLLRASSCFK
jgi:23S rRNA pseudouridine1911/1915/1917 synthase